MSLEGGVSDGDPYSDGEEDLAASISIVESEYVAKHRRVDLEAEGHSEPPSKIISEPPSQFIDDKSEEKLVDDIDAQSIAVSLSPSDNDQEDESHQKEDDVVEDENVAKIVDEVQKDPFVEAENDDDKDSKVLDKVVSDFISDPACVKKEDVSI